MYSSGQKWCPIFDYIALSDLIIIKIRGVWCKMNKTLNLNDINLLNSKFYGKLQAGYSLLHYSFIRLIFLIVSILLCMFL